MTPASAMPDFRYRAFISYSHQDKSWADWLHKALETYAIPQRLVGKTTAAGVIPKRLAPIFRDREELASATDLGRKVSEALAQSANLIVICSPRSATSHWVNEEVLAFKRLGRDERIFCLIVEGEPNAGDAAGPDARECFAPALRHTLGADGQPGAQRREPVAADARAGRDGKGNAKLKLIAGLLDLDYDRLKQRELKRRHRRMAAITTLALVVMALTTMLAVAALFARHAAVVARNDAERRQKQAENLVGFMLGDLNDKLAQVKRLDILEAVDDKAMAYFASLPTGDVTDQALGQRAKALEKIGNVRQEQGHLPAALQSYQAAAKLAGALAHAAPRDAARQVAYSRTLAYVGMTYWYQGRLDDAQHAFEAAQRALQGARAQAGQDPALLSQLSSIDNNIGHVLEARSELDQAATQYRQMLALAQQLVALQPDRAEWAVQLGSAHNNLGKLALLHGDLATAVAQYGADDAIESRLAAGDPRNNSQHENMLIVRAILGRTLAMTGNDAAGMRDLQQAVDLATELARVDPRNGGIQEDLARYATQLARLRRLNGDPAAGTTLNTRALSILARLARQDSTDAELQRELAEAQAEQAAQSLAGGQLAAARAQAKTALDGLAPLLARQPHNRTTLLATLDAQLLLARLTADPGAAMQLRREVADRARDQPGGRGDPRLQSLRVQALLALGNRAEAQALTRQLWNSGYRDAQLLAALPHAGAAYPPNAAFRKQLAAASAGTAAASR